MVTSSKDPPCSRCLENDRMLNLPDTTTDFGGVVSVWVCQRCGIVAVLTWGKGRQKRAGDGYLAAGPGGRQRGVEISTPLWAVAADG